MKPGSLFSRKAGLGLLAAVLIVGFGWVVARSGPLSPIRVTSLRVEAGALSPAIFGIGTVEARRSYLIGPTAAGRVRVEVTLQDDGGTAGGGVDTTVKTFDIAISPVPFRVTLTMPQSRKNRRISPMMSEKA